METGLLWRNWTMNFGRLTGLEIRGERWQKKERAMEFLEKIKVPYAVTALVGVNVLYFLYLLLTGSLSGMSLVQKGAIYIVNRHYRRGLYPLVASMFVHFDIRHIGGIG
ncbi:MAG: hypothetical protein V8S96_00290 [Lachnospiraceae bacterium]